MVVDILDGIEPGLNLHARLYDGDETLRHINLFFAHSTMKHLLDIHRPFQIDGNFESTARIIELFIQSHNNQIRPLQALPSGIKNCEVKGACARILNWTLHGLIV